MHNIYYTSCVQLSGKMKLESRISSSVVSAVQAIAIILRIKVLHRISRTLY